METLIALRGPDLLRVKGLLNVAGCQGPVVLQVVQHLSIRRSNSRPGRTRTAPAGWCSSPATCREQQVRDLLAVGARLPKLALGSDLSPGVFQLTGRLD